MRYWARDWDQVGAEARRAAATAQSLDPSLGEGYLAEALVAMGDNDHGKGSAWPDEHIAALLKRAVELSPNNASATKFYAQYATSDDEVLALYQRAAQLDPRSGIIRHNIAERYLDRGRYDLALEWFLQSAQATEPYFALAYMSISNMYLFNSGEIDRAARWARANRDAHPQDWRGHIVLIRALIELGLLDEARRALDAIPPDPADSVDRPLLWVRLFEGTRVAVAAGELGTAERLAAEFKSMFLEPRPDWPDLSQVPAGYLFPLDAWALADIRNGRPMRALQRYQAGSVDPALILSLNLGPALLRTPVLIAALHKEIGEHERAGQILRSYLARIAAEPIRGNDGIGFTRFTIHAFLGETDAAIAALDAALKEGWVAHWWALEQGAFDPEYAAVLADPRFAAIRSRIEARIKAMRESYQAHPDLPEGYSIP